LADVEFLYTKLDYYLRTLAQPIDILIAAQIRNSFCLRCLAILIVRYSVFPREEPKCVRQFERNAVARPSGSSGDGVEQFAS